MPYKRVGVKIYVQRAGKWTLKQTCENIARAKKALRLLWGIHRGWHPTEKR